MKRGITLFASAALGLLVLAAPAFAQSKYLKNAQQGDPGIKSIESLTFGPQGLLVIADGAGKQIVAIDTQDTKKTEWSTKKIENIGQQLAARLGTTAKAIEITRLAVNPASQRVYVAVKKRDDGKSVLLTVDGSGKVGLFDLENVKYARAKLSADEPVTNFTDIAWAEDRILAAAQARATFSSKVFAVNVPVENDAKGAIYNTETYHVAHGKWETRSPIYAMMTYAEKGKQYVVGAFTCTPVVKFRVDDLTSGGKVKGQSLIEVGNGNRPRDMFAYTKNGKKHIMMNTIRMKRFHDRLPVGPSQYWVVRIDYNLLTENEKVNQNAIRRVNRKYENVTDRANVVQTFHGVMFMDQLDDNRAAVIREAGDQQNLEVLALP